MNLILTQIPKDYHSQFPPVFKPSAQATSNEFFISPHVDTKFSLSDYYPYFWYSPVPQLK